MKQSLLVFYLLVLSTFFMKGQVTIQATVPSVIASNGEMTFDVKINKGAVSNFAKYQIDVPQGVTLSEVNSRTGSFSFDGSRGKVIWVAIPTEAEFVLTIKMITSGASGSGVIHQKFYYLEGGSKKEVEAEPINVSFGEGRVAAAITPTVAASYDSNATGILPENPAPAAATEKIASDRTEEPVKTTEKKEIASVEQPKEQLKTVSAPAIAAGAAKGGGNLVYKIQIGAYGENPGKTKYKSLADVAILREGDFFKVLVGNFKTREEATQRKNELLEKGFKGFVVSYENGQRVK